MGLQNSLEEPSFIKDFPEVTKLHSASPQEDHYRPGTVQGLYSEVQFYVHNNEIYFIYKPVIHFN